MRNTNGAVWSGLECPSVGVKSSAIRGLCVLQSLSLQYCGEDACKIKCEVI